MAIYEFRCSDKLCDLAIDEISIERRLPTFAHTQEQFCEVCGSQIHLVPSVPAKVRVGKYGKGGGLNGDR